MKGSGPMGKNCSFMNSFVYLIVGILGIDVQGIDI
jgi:hypothetical protein